MFFRMISDHSKKQTITLWKQAIICGYSNGRLIWKVASWKVRKKATDVCRSYSLFLVQNASFESKNFCVLLYVDELQLVILSDWPMLLCKIQWCKFAKVHSSVWSVKLFFIHLPVSAMAASSKAKALSSSAIVFFGFDCFACKIYLLVFSW